jgi:two-component system LytT family response regulator
VRAVRTVVVDDEPLCRERVCALLETWPQIVVAGECARGENAVRLIRSTRVDLLFLDVQLPDFDGFEVLERCDPERTPLVVFVTAFSDYAVDAFEVHAIDYLLKPIERERFDVAVARSLAALEEPIPPLPAERLNGLLRTVRPSSHYDRERLLVRIGERLVFVRATDVDWIESAGNYVMLHIGRQTHLMRETMARLESRLAISGFARIHRQALVNLDALSELRPDESGEYVAQLRTGELLAVSRRCRQRLEAQFIRRS